MDMEQGKMNLEHVHSLLRDWDGTCLAPLPCTGLALFLVVPISAFQCHVH